MFKLLNGREHFFQWDLNQTLIIEDPSVTEVHFCNRTDDCSLVCEVYEQDGLRLVNVPNILLQNSWDVRAYAYCDDCYTKQSAKFKVEARTKPADYVYTETEVKTWEQLEQMIEDNLSDEKIAELINGYLEENPIESGATAEQAAQIEQNKKDIKELQEKEVDLSGYALKSEIPDVSGYALKSEIPDVSNYITMSQVEAKGYQTANDVASAINEALGVIENGTY